MARLRPLEAVRFGWGSLLLLRPQPVLAVVTGRPATPAGRRILRVLAARHLVQAAIGTKRHTKTVLTVNAAVDGLHALSCGLAALNPAVRRAALADGLVASAFCLASTASARRLPRA